MSKQKAIVPVHADIMEKARAALRGTSSCTSDAKKALFQPAQKEPPPPTASKYD
jgi:hypothetical protein